MPVKKNVGAGIKRLICPTTGHLLRGKKSITKKFMSHEFDINSFIATFF